VSETQQKTIVPMSETQRWSMGTAQWFLLNEKGKTKYPPVFHNSISSPYICGKEAFKKIQTDIENAKESIDIICWGFDPAMELDRTTNKWPRGKTWGELLSEAGMRGVTVRLLPWYSILGDYVQNNIVGNRYPLINEKKLS
jgi:hypothetical protein